MYSCFKNAILFLSLSSAAFTTSFADEAVRSDYDRLRIEGVYEVKTVYNSPDGQKNGRIDRVVIYLNSDSTTYTIALSMSKFNTTFFLFNNGHLTIEENLLKVKASGDVGNDTYAQINMEFNRETLELKGNFVDSIAEGYKKFEGKPVSSLSMCLYQSESTHFKFPDINTLVGVYISENGKDLLYFRSYEDGALSLVVKKALSFEIRNVPYQGGVYNQDFGVITFLWSDQYTTGKLNVSLRWAESQELDEVARLIDTKKLEEERPYLKVFGINSGAQQKITKYKYLRPFLEAEL